MKKFMVLLMILIITSPIGMYALCYYILSYTPDDATIIYYVEEFIQQDLDNYDYQLLQTKYSTNIREHSIFAIIELNEDFVLNRISTSMTDAEISHIDNILQTLYSPSDMPQDCAMYANAEESLYYIYDPERNWLIFEFD